MPQNPNAIDSWRGMFWLYFTYPNCNQQFFVLMLLLSLLVWLLPYYNLQYRIGQLYSIAMMSKEETSGGEGVEILKNEPFENEAMGKGQYTYKIYHVAK